MVVSMIAALAAQAMTPEEVQIEGPEGPIVGTLTDPSDDAPLVILTAGSGPTDRNGDNPLASAGRIYEQLANGLAEQGVAMIRYDKRGMFGSGKAIANANNVRIADYAGDVRNWVKLAQERGRDCAWLMGHSEGGIVTLLAAQDTPGVCGIILLASPGRPITVLLREQLGKQLPPAMMADVEDVLLSLEAGEKADTSKLVPGVAIIFNEQVQPYLIDLATNDPAAMAAASDLPLLIVHFVEDLQVIAADADAFTAARPDATRVDLDGVNHAFKPAAPGDAAANAATYGNADLKIDPRLAATIAEFVRTAK